jgi:hypothetical protein
MTCIAPLHFLVLDFSLVVHVDCTTLMALTNIVKQGELRGFDLYLCGFAAKPALAQKLRLLAPSRRLIFIYHDVDHALEACENRLLMTFLGDFMTPSTRARATTTAATLRPSPPPEQYPRYVAIIKSGLARLVAIRFVIVWSFIMDVKGIDI